MSLVDGNGRDDIMPRIALHPLEEPPVLESLGSDVGHEILAYAQQVLRMGPLFRAQLGVDADHSVDTAIPQILHLIVHQRQNRAHDKGHARRDQGEQLEHTRLSATRGQEDDSVATLYPTHDGLGLTRTKVGEPENVVQEEFQTPQIRRNMGRLAHVGEGKLDLLGFPREGRDAHLAIVEGVDGIAPAQHGVRATVPHRQIDAGKGVGHIVERPHMPA